MNPEKRRCASQRMGRGPDWVRFPCFERASWQRPAAFNDNSHVRFQAQVEKKVAKQTLWSSVYGNKQLHPKLHMDLRPPFPMCVRMTPPPDPEMRELFTQIGCINLSRPFSSLASTGSFGLLA